MGHEVRANQADYQRLKEINSELSNIAHQTKSCREKTQLFAVLGGVILAASIIGLIQTLISEDSDWATNPDSPVYAIAAEDQTASKIFIPVSVTGMIIGLGLFLRARRKTCAANDLEVKTRGLVEEMRALRDRMYPREAEKRDMRFAPPKAHPEPMQPDEARSEYVGVYSPPGSHRSPEEPS